MNANDSLERGIADVYEREAPQRAPDWVLATALETIESTPQRRVLLRVPWRFPHMNTFAKVAIAAVVVLAIGAVGLSLLPRSSSGVGGQPTLSPLPSPSPSLSASPDPSAPPPLSETFTSTMHGISIDYPTGWATAPATQPWISTTGADFMSPATDHIYDPVLQDHLFLSDASQPLAGVAGDTWVTEILGDPDEGCDPAIPPESITLDGANGRICGDLVALSTQDRGYFIRLYTSGDEPWVDTHYDNAWFRSVLATVQLDPASARDPSPSASPSA
jgi:hypothetical protein